MTFHQHDLFAGMRRPPLPDDFKAPILTAAAAAIGASPSLTDRLWESRALRLGWATVVVLLLGVQLLLAGLPAGRRLPAGHRGGAESRSLATSWPDEPYLVRFLEHYRSVTPAIRGWPRSLRRFVEPSETGVSSGHDPKSFGGSG